MSLVFWTQRYAFLVICETYNLRPTILNKNKDKSDQKERRYSKKYLLIFFYYVVIKYYLVKENGAASFVVFLFLFG